MSVFKNTSQVTYLHFPQYFIYLFILKKLFKKILEGCKHEGRGKEMVSDELVMEKE